MTQILLRGNRRIGMLAALVLVFVLSGIVGCMVAWPSTFIIVGGSVALMLLLPVAFVICQLCFVPRLSIDDDTLFVFVSNSARPTAVPLDNVEVFFMGQGAVQGDEPGHPREYQGAVAANVIVRLAESATDWHSRDVNQRLAVWRDGYITVRGLWCEDINQELLATMNRRLSEAKRRRRQRESS